MIRRAALGLLTLTAFAVSAPLVADDPTPAERAIDYRQSVLTVIATNLGPMVPMVRGEAPFDSTVFVKQGERLAVLAPMVLEGFRMDTSDAGVTTEAKPEIWAEFAEFEKLASDLEAKTAALAEIAASGDEGAIKGAFGEMAQACKACHDRFRED